MMIIYVANLAAVGVFGIILSALFCDIKWTRKNRTIFILVSAAILLLQGIVFKESSLRTVYFFYPLITHLPLAVTLCILSKSYLWPVITVLTAYLFCQIRRWLALCVVTLFAGDARMQNIVELIITVPLFLFLVKFVAPSVRSVSRQALSLQWQFGVVPALYYGFDYVTRVYSDLLKESSQAALEFMPFVCSVGFLLFVLFGSKKEKERIRLEQMQNSLNLQIAGAAREIDSLRVMQQKTRIYRHDLRHHMQYLSSCIENGLLDQAQTYIGDICSEIEVDRVIDFCENEAANLIFSAFAGRAEKEDIPIEIKATLPREISVSEKDLCVLLSNALENALNACRKRKEKGMPAMIEVIAYERGGKLFLQITNSCDENIVFAEGLPVASMPGHGIGIRCICAIVGQYGGMYNFLVKDRKFILQASL